MEKANKLKTARDEYGLTNKTVGKLLQGIPTTSINVYMSAPVLGLKPANEESGWAKTADEKGQILHTVLKSIEENIRLIFIEHDIEWERESALCETCLYIYRVPTIYKLFAPVIKRDIKIIANQLKG